MVVGGGYAGMSAARAGIKVALVQNRPVLGGNASSEIRVPLRGQSPAGGPYPRLGRVVSDLQYDPRDDARTATLADLAGTLRRAKPYLMCVIIQGTDEDRATHKILGEGSFDMAPLVRTLREMDHRGPLGTMGFTQSGDIPGKLERARRAWERTKQDALERER